MLHHGRQRHAMWLSQLRDGSLAQHERGKDSAARGIGQGAKGGIERSRILNHTV